MAKEKKLIRSDDTNAYMVRTDNRIGTIADANMKLIGYFMGLGNDQATATDKSDQVAYELLKTHTYAVEGYERGNSRCKTDLINAINNIDEGAFPFFDAVAKAFVVDLIQ